MKRNENLMPLSRDHHFGLLCVWKIKEGLENDISYNRIKDYVNYFWTEKLSHHFKTEDKVFESIERDEKFLKMENEHLEIEKLVDLINQSEDKNLLFAFAEALKCHIRFEEREMFPALEQKLSDAELSKIGTELEKLIIDREDDYPDQFWKKD